MPVDTSIYSRIESPQIDIAGSLGRAMSLQQMRQQGRMLDRQEQAVQGAADREARLRQLFGSGQPVTPEALMEAAGPEDGLKLLQGIEAYNNVKAKRIADAKTEAGRLAAGLKVLPEDVRAQMWPSVRQAAIEAQLGDAQTLPEQVTPEFLDAIVTWAGGTPTKPETPKTREVTVTNPDGTQTIQIVEDKPGQQFTSTPPKKEPTLYPVTVDNGRGRPMRKLFTAEQLAQGVEEYKPPSSTATSRFWVMRDGKAVRITEAEYRLGDTPASTREQGRPVTSGDAGKIADFDTSLDDAAVLKKTLTETNSATGTAAAIGGAMPAWATDLFGWGTDAKKRQGVIDRVKQVIGKALEGGVLRKEDEYKYEKILPTLKDKPEVALSKIEGLERALTLRRQTTLDALADAGYEVGAYNQREATRPPRDDGSRPAGQFSVKAPDGKTYTFPNAQQLAAFKARAGIR